MFKLAMINDLCSKNPVVEIKLRSTSVKKEKKYLSAAQHKKAIQWALKRLRKIKKI